MNIKVAIVILCSLAYLIPSTAILINDFFLISFIRNNIELIRIVQKYEFGVLTGSLGLIWLVAFYRYKKFSEYNFHDLSGIFGVFLSALSLCAISFYQSPAFVLFFSLSGMLCIYCVSVPLFDWFKGNVKDYKFEVTFISLVFGSVVIYILNGYSSGLINKVFGINGQYFNYAKPVAMLLVSTPWLAIVSFISILYITMGQNESTGIEMFYSINKLSACYVILMLSISFGSQTKATLELVAGKFDFDSRSPCVVAESVIGVIVLDPGHTRVLAKTKVDNNFEYNVIRCTLPE